jgi:hypothetical protein
MNSITFREVILVSICGISFAVAFTILLLVVQ